MDSNLSCAIYEKLISAQISYLTLPCIRIQPKTLLFSIAYRFLIFFEIAVI